MTTPNGEELGPVDTGGAPESLPLTIEETGDHTITLAGFGGATGDSTVDVRRILGPSATTTDLNLLLFTAGGNFLGAAGDDNTLTGQPNEILSLPGPPVLPCEVQLVIAKTTAVATPVSEIGHINNGGI